MYTYMKCIILGSSVRLVHTCGYAYYIEAHHANKTNAELIYLFVSVEHFSFSLDSSTCVSFHFSFNRGKMAFVLLILSCIQFSFLLLHIPYSRYFLFHLSLFHAGCCSSSTVEYKQMSLPKTKTKTMYSEFITVYAFFWFLMHSTIRFIFGDLLIRKIINARVYGWGYKHSLHKRSWHKLTRIRNFAYHINEIW